MKVHLTRRPVTGYCIYGLLRDVFYCTLRRVLLWIETCSTVDGDNVLLYMESCPIVDEEMFYC